MWCVWTLTLYAWLFREKFIRLQHENKMLRVQQEECEREKIAALQAQLEEAHKTRSELDTDNRWTESISLCKSATDRHERGSLSSADSLLTLFSSVLVSCVKFLFQTYSFVNISLPLHRNQSADWVESGSVSCSSRLRTSRRLCRVRRPSLMMWVCQEHWHQYRENAPQTSY